MGKFSFNKGDRKYKRRDEFFKGETGKNYRLSHAWFEIGDDGLLDLDTDPLFTGEDCHYIQGLHYVKHRGPEFTEYTGKQPRSRIGSIFVKWPTNAKGKLLKESLEDDYAVLYWGFGEGKYEELSDQHELNPFNVCDILVKCTAKEYQKMTFRMARESALVMVRDKRPALFKQISEEVAHMAESIDSKLWKDEPLEKLKQRLRDRDNGGSGGGGGRYNNTPTDDDLGVGDDEADDLIDGILS